MPTVASDAPESSMAYRLHASDLVARLGTNEQSGLSDEEARARLAQYGSNELAAEKPVPAWRRFLSQFQDVLVILLLVATAISAALWVVERDAALPVRSDRDLRCRAPERDHGLRAGVACRGCRRGTSRDVGG